MRLWTVYKTRQVKAVGRRSGFGYAIWWYIPLYSLGSIFYLSIYIWFYACYHSVQNLLSSRLPSRNLKIKIYTIRTITLPVVLYGCETWSLTLREERRLRVFENRVLRKVFGPKRDEVTREWRKLHNEELNDL